MTPEEPPIVQLEGVTKVYRSGTLAVHALRGISLALGRGGFLAVMGASGSGKSTLMHITGCLDRPTEGSYRLGGAEVEKMAPDELADARNRQIGFVFQAFNLLGRTSAFENVEVPLLYTERSIPSVERRDRVMAALERVGMAHRAMNLPSQLSGGEQQRVAIARALINRPAILLADEPTGALDSRTSLSIMELFVRLNDEGHTIVLVTHEHDVASFARRQIVLRDGQIIRDEPVRRRADARQAFAALGRDLGEAET